MIITSYQNLIVAATQLGSLLQVIQESKYLLIPLLCIFASVVTLYLQFLNLNIS
jgi:hypothetical protein